jgi:uncharacterized protein
MIFSRHNIVSRIADSDEYFIVNLLSGNADILSKEKGEEVLERRFTNPAEYVEKGYLVDEAEEDRLYRKRYADFVDARESDEVQIFFVPWYSCNFACSYCYQEGYGNGHGLPTNEVIDAFFRYVGKEFAGRKKYLTLFGGEPLLPGPGYEGIIRRFLEKAKEAGLETAIVTNGYTLQHYAEILSDYRIREVQVTLDGPPDIHDLRRPLKGGQPTFDKIADGIDKALALGIMINLRVVIDRQNIGVLPSLARIAIDKGWTRSPHFKTQLGRNYELHSCQTDRGRLLSRVEMYQVLYGLLKGHPEVLEFHKPAFSISKFLFENGELPSPLYDSCPGTKTEWAFDYAGSIYSCTATVGKQGEALGSFFPDISKKEALIEQWEERDVTSIPACSECNLRLACGGGCASVALNATGKILAPDCRPVRELLELGIATYFKKELA